MVLDTLQEMEWRLGFTSKVVLTTHGSVHVVYFCPRFTFTMVVGAFPLFKLVSLAVKQISKPVANSLKSAAKQNEFFRRYVCVWPGQGKLRSSIGSCTMMQAFIFMYTCVT